MASPGAGTVRGMDSLLNVLMYKDQAKRQDNRVAERQQIMKDRTELMASQQKLDNLK